MLKELNIAHGFLFEHNMCSQNQMATTLVGKLFIVNKALCTDKYTVTSANTWSYQDFFRENLVKSHKNKEGL
jgi:hypothetical protein